MSEKITRQRLPFITERAKRQYLRDLYAKACPEPGAPIGPHRVLKGCLAGDADQLSLDSVHLGKGGAGFNIAHTPLSDATESEELESDVNPTNSLFDIVIDHLLGYLMTSLSPSLSGEESIEESMLLANKKETRPQ
ncbi:hypothetical protein PGT21_025799 [Puccinia graminis f. sp. tritici]|uniref:Uncharacterized protein n=1 Tax=Puccinia graminis f. sp. tritici TaxID=56615 RepID=A0A5B0NEM8_PUCGR|nr:hypothetical protein PGT21_025799 [Puccinia graminis f. sp. tritici]